MLVTVSCCELFKQLNIPPYIHNILLLLLFAVKNKNQLKSNSKFHSINHRHRSELFPPPTKLAKYHKAVHYSRNNFFSRLPKSIKNLSWNVKKLN
jgi:hypothetical protein